MSQSARAAQLGGVLSSLLSATPELEAAEVVSFDGLPMASALPAGMDETRVAAMSAALLSLGERAAEGLGRGELSQVYIEAAGGTVFLVSADGEAVLVAVAERSAKAGLVLYELRRAARQVGGVLRAEAASKPVHVPGAATEAASAAPESGYQPDSGYQPEPAYQPADYPPGGYQQPDYQRPDYQQPDYSQGDYPAPPYTDPNGYPAVPAADLLPTWPEAEPGESAPSWS